MKNFDWTYSTLWSGGVGTGEHLGNSSDFEPLDPPPELHPTSSFNQAQDSQDRIPIERLGAGSEPILFFDQFILFEDELHDNGSSILDIKVVRLRPSSCQRPSTDPVCGCVWGWAKARNAISYLGAATVLPARGPSGVPGDGYPIVHPIRKGRV